LRFKFMKNSQQIQISLLKPFKNGLKVQAECLPKRFWSDKTIGNFRKCNSGKNRDGI